MDHKLSNPKLVVAVTSILVIAVLGWIIYRGSAIKPVNAGEISVTATKQNVYGVALDSAFQISFGSEVDAKTIRKELVVKPALAYDLKKTSGGRAYQIIPRQPLVTNTVYQFAFDPSGQQQEALSWAFQTTGEFRLMSTLPRTEAVGVPVDSGIEFTFSDDSFDLDQATKLIKISPQLEGKFEKHKKTLVFIPKQMAPATLYTITFSKGLAGVNHQTITDDYQLRFETASTSNSVQEFNFYLDNRVTEFSTSQVPTFPLSLITNAPVPRPDINLYQFPDADSFGKAQQRLKEIPYWCVSSDDQFRVDVKKLNHRAEYQTSFNQASPDKYLIALPDKLEAGYYLMEIKANKQVKQVIFQVSDLVVYRVQGERQAMFWVNDLNTQKPVARVDAWSGKKKIASGDDQGVILINKQLTTDSSGQILLKSGLKELLVPLDSSKNLGSPEAQLRFNYWKYLYLDRELYLPGDTVHYWGVLSARDQKQEIKEKVTLELWGGDYYFSEERSAEPLYTQEVKVNGNTFSGACRLPVLKPGYYYLALKINQVEITSRGFSVATYQKPAYQVAIVPDKKAIIAGEKVNYHIKSSFFEGTAVPGLSLNYYLDGKEGKVVTNNQGEATVSYTGSYQPDNFAAYNYDYFNVNTSTPESGDIGDYNGVLVFPASVMVRADAKTRGTNYELTARLNRIDLSAVDNGGYVSEENYLRDPVAGGKIAAKLYKEIWTRTPNGQSYDYINKKVIPNYNYSFSSQLVSSFDLITNQKGEVKYQGTLDKGYSYYLELTAADAAGRNGRARIYIGEFYDDLYSNNYYSFKDRRNKPYIPGDKVSLDLMKNSSQLDPAGRSILYFQGQNKIDAYKVSQDAHYDFAFADTDIPNTNVYGVYFDGATYQETSNYIVAFDRQSRNLKVIINTDQKEYRPGDTVKLSVLIQDSKGKAVKDSHLNLNLVDEALYRLMDQQVDILGGLYGDYLTPVLISWKSHYHPQLGGGAEQGGEGSGERRDFRDTVLFKDLITDSKGQAEVSFKLPDNLTSWRVTYHAVTEKLMASSGTAQIPVRLPFFVNLNLNSSYQSGDVPVIVLRSFGSKLSPKQRVNYQVTVTDPQGKQQNIKGNSSAFAAYDCTLAALKEGKYTVKIIASSGKYQDTLIQNFLVAKDVIKRQVVEPFILKADNKITANSQEPITLVFSDYARSQSLEGLYQLSWLYGSRVEHRVASQEANKLLKHYFPNNNSGNLLTQSSILNYQQVDGGISILPYGTSDLQVSARIAALAPQEFDQRALRGYFYRLLDGAKTENRSLIWLGLASLDEPVLISVKEALKNDNLTPEEKINLNMALLELGDGANATKLYHELLSKYSQDLGNSTRINVGKDQDEIITATTQMALLAARLDQPEKQRLLGYLLANPGEEIVNSLEILQILKYNLQYMNTEVVSFTYQLNDVKVNCKLKADEPIKLTVLPQDLASLKFSKIKGQVGVLKYYSVPLSSNQGINKDLAIKRSYYTGEKATLNMSRTDLVKIVINTSVLNMAPGGSYEVIDVLPAGLAYLERPYSPGMDITNLPDWPTEVNGRQLTFVVPKGQSEITYYARVTTAGKYTAEAPLLQHAQNAKVYARGSLQELTIK